LAINAKKIQSFFHNNLWRIKFGRGDDIEKLKISCFKDVSVTEDNSILFNAEEYFVNFECANKTQTGSRAVKWGEISLTMTIVSAKLNSEGGIHLGPEILTSAEVTQGVGAYASYSFQR